MPFLLFFTYDAGGLLITGAAPSSQVLHYANKLEPEAPADITETTPPAEWPSEGRISFDKCVDHV